MSELIAFNPAQSLPSPWLVDKVISDLRLVANDYSSRYTLIPQAQDEARRIAAKIEADPASLLPLEAAWVGAMLAERLILNARINVQGGFGW